uniref:Uncharacterized protein n=1 Tax=Opuntia streptacantha TaxID=393608 RepID=A0A7C9EV87_OPUST
MRPSGENNIFNKISLRLRFFHWLKTLMHHFQSDTKLAIVLRHGQIIIIVITTRIVKGWFDQGPSQIIVTNENGFPKELLETPVYLFTGFAAKPILFRRNIHLNHLSISYTVSVKLPLTLIATKNTIVREMPCIHIKLAFTTNSTTA